MSNDESEHNPSERCLYLHMAGHRYGALTLRIILVLNAGAWFAFWALFAQASRPYVQHRPVWEEKIPNVVVFHRATSPAFESQVWPFSVVLLANLPSFAAIRFPTVFAINRHPELWDLLFGGTSVHGYIIIGTMLLSFVQWYWVTRLIVWLVSRLGHVENRQLS